MANPLTQAAQQLQQQINAATQSLRQFSQQTQIQDFNFRRAAIVGQYATSFGQPTAQQAHQLGQIGRQQQQIAFSGSLQNLQQQLEGVNERLARQKEAIAESTQQWHTAAIIAGTFNRHLGQAVAGIGQIGVGMGKQSAGIGGKADIIMGAAALATTLIQTVQEMAYKAANAASGGSMGTTLNKSFELLAGTIGRVLVPAFAIVGAAALTAADYIGDVVDKLGFIADVWEFVIDKAAESVKIFGTVIGVATENLRNLALLLTNPVGAGRKFIGDVFGSEGGANVGQRLRESGAVTRWGVGGDFGDTGTAMRAAGGVGGQGGGGSIVNLFRRNIREFITNMEQEVGPKASIGGIIEKRQQVQLAGQQSDLEKRQQENLRKLFDFLEGMMNRHFGKPNLKDLDVVP